MSNERIDDFLSWRGRLEDPEGLPGQALDDREATWERLMDKLRERPRRRFSGYRIAAACLLLALIPAFRLFQNRHGNPIALQPVTTHRATPVATPRIARQQPAFASANPHPAKTATPAKTTPAKTTRPTIPYTPSASPLHVAPAFPLAAAPPVPPALIATTHNTPPHKEWKVVNIGEINSSLARPHGTAANAPRFGLGDPAVSSDAGPTPQDPPGLKIKLSAQN